MLGFCGRVQRSGFRRLRQILSNTPPNSSPSPELSVYRKSKSFLSQRTIECLPGDFGRRASLGFCRRSRFAAGFTPLKPKTLDSIIDIERAKTLSPEDLVSVWDDMPHLIVTSLEDYKARGTQASPYLTVTYFKDLAETKDVVLIRGDIVFTSKLSDPEAKWLIETTHSFYLSDGRYKLVERFNKETHEFEFSDVLKALEMPSL